MIGAAGMPIIVAIVYYCITLYKQVVKGKKKKVYHEIIPLIAGFLGMVFAVIAFYLAPGAIVADNLLTAIFIGLTSGLASTGTHQIFKQLCKPGECKEDGAK